MATLAIAMHLKSALRRKACGEYVAICQANGYNRYLDPEGTFTDALLDAQMDARRTGNKISDYVIKRGSNEVRCF